MWEGGGGFPPPRVGRFLKICVKKHDNDISCTLNGIIRGSGYVKLTYTNPLRPPFILKNYFDSNQGGPWPLVPLAMPVTVVQPGFVNGGPKRGSEATESGGGGIPLPR